MEQRKITAKDVLSLLKQRFIASDGWMCAAEVQRTTGWSDRRYDFVAMNCWKSNAYRIEVVEIKVSKADLRRELAEPEKHNVLFEDIDYYSLAAPVEIIDMSIIPPKWGIYAVVDGKLVVKRKPLALHDEARNSVPRAFAASFLRAAIQQNLDKFLLTEEKRKSYDEGYARCKSDLGQMSDSWNNYERVRKENGRMNNLLADLGIFSIDDEQDQAQIARLKRLSDINTKLDVAQMEWTMRSLEEHVSRIKAALASLQRFHDGLAEDSPVSASEKCPAPLTSEEKKDIISWN